MDIEIDNAEVRKLEASLTKVPAEAMKEVKAVVQRGALNIKKDWQRRWSGHDHIPHLPRAISYDTTTQVASVEAEIGVDKAKPQGPLGNLIEFGSVNNAPIPGGAPALDDEEPKFTQYLGEAISKPLEG